MTANPKRILVVEDNRADVVLLQEMLLRDAQGQFDLVWASTLRETLDRIEGEQFDAILLDLSLPDSYGLDTITRLCTALPAMPILVLTGLADEQIASEAVRCGAEDYLIKGQTDARSMGRAIRYAIDRKWAEEALRASECRLRTLGDQIPGGAIYQYVRRPDGQVDYAYISAGIEQVLGLSAQSAMADPVAFRQLIVEQDRERVAAAEERSARDLAPFDCEFRQRTVTGEIKWVQCRATPRRLEGGSVLWDGIMVDSTERKRREEQIAKLTRLYAVLSEVNEAIVRARTAEPLYSAVCRILAERGGFRLAWIGEVGPQRVVPRAAWGPATGYLRDLRVELQGALGGGPTGTCIRENRAVVNPDFAVNRGTAPWRDSALQHGFRASAAFPLRRQGQAIGALTLYADEPHAFDAEQVGLLEALSADVSYALDAMDHEQIRVSADQALRASEARYRNLFTTMNEGFALHELICDDAGQPCDYRFLEVNPAFEQATGLRAADVVGRTLREVLPDSEPLWLQRYGRVVLSGQPDHFEDYHQPTGRWYEVYASRTAPGQFAVVFLNVTERKRAEEAMREAKAAAVAANAAKSQFLANMSHELRTPMNAILGMIDVALPKATDPVVQDCLQTARGSADLLLTLLNDLLDSARIESGKLELEAAPFSLRRMVGQITRTLSARASEKGVGFSCRLPEGTPDALLGDRMRLQQVLLNLAGNAIKFTERGDVEISVRALSQAGEACLEFAVRDTGIGIPPATLELLFQPFAQADASMARRFGGTGLGLSISKNLVELMGGRITVESQLGQGSTFAFTVRLPLAHEVPADHEAPAVLPRAACAPLRLLLVEDNPANQKLATYILQDRGHRVDLAGDGQEAISLAEQRRYDVILMDVQMPGMDGLEAALAIRTAEQAAAKGTDAVCPSGPRPASGACPDSQHSAPSPARPRVPIIAMTAHALRGDRERCLAAGMDGYLAKPINGQELISLVETLAAGSPSDAASEVRSAPTARRGSSERPRV